MGFIFNVKIVDKYIVLRYINYIEVRYIVVRYDGVSKYL